MKQKIRTCNNLFILINLILFLITDFIGIFLNIDWWETCGLGWQKVFQDKEYYRLITSMFLHADLDHVFNNMLVLFVIGNYLEQQLGHLRYTILYFSTGIIAGFTSIILSLLILSTWFLSKLHL